MTDYNLLYQMSELCKENDISFGIRHGLLFVDWVDFEKYSKPLRFKQCFTLEELENIYKTLDNVVDEFLSRRDAELEKLKEESEQNDE